MNRSLAAGGEPLALAWTALRETWPIELAIDGANCRNGRELVELFAGYTVPCMNMVWADSGGNIGYKLVGRLPIRRGGCPDLPKPGWDGGYEWDGYVPYEDLPEIVNPPGGTIVTANNRIAPDDYPHHITSEYMDGYRAARIEQMLAERERHSLEDFARMQTDVLSIPGGETARRLCRLEPESQREVRAIERLKSWDHQLTPETIAGTIVHVFTVHFARAIGIAVIGDDEQAARWISKGRLGFTAMNPSPWRFQARMLELWAEGDEELIGGQSWDDLALRAFSTALDELESRYGADPKAWRWGRVHGARFPHALSEGRGPIAGVLDRILSRRVPAGGAQETVNAVGYVAHGGDYTGVWAPSFRLLADVGDPTRSRWQHMTGQSGHPGSPHYDDLLDAWLAGETNEFGQPAVATLKLEPT
jgi:penicillin G amidase